MRSEALRLAPAAQMGLGFSCPTPHKPQTS